MGEAEALCLLRKRTSVPVPQTFNAYMIEGIGFILMENVPGVSLEKCQKDLPRYAKRSIIQQHQSYIQEWRKVEGPCFRSTDGGPCEYVFIRSWDPEPRQYGPFPTRKEFNQGVVQALCNSRPNGKLTKKDEPLAERIFASGENGEGGRKVFTHGDLHQSNIMVDENVITAVIYWGAAGYSIMAREYFGLRWQALDLEWRDLIYTKVEADEYGFWAWVNQSTLDYTGFWVRHVYPGV